MQKGQSPQRACDIDRNLRAMAPMCYLVIDEVFGLLEAKTTRELSKEEKGNLAVLSKEEM